MPKRGVYCVMPMAPLALPPAACGAATFFLGANNVQRCTGALVGALMGALAGGCLGWWVPWLVGALVGLLAVSAAAGGCLQWVPSVSAFGGCLGVVLLVGGGCLGRCLGGCLGWCLGGAGGGCLGG
jgi:hypothetical protein